MSLSLFWNPKTIVLHSIAVYKTFRSFDFNDLENTARGTNKGILVEKFLTNSIGVRFACSRATTMLDKQYHFISRLITDLAIITYEYSDRCIKNRLGGFCQLSKNTWCLEQYENDSTYQFSGTESNLSGPINFHKRNIN